MTEKVEIADLASVGVNFIGYSKSYDGTTKTLPAAITYQGKSYALKQATMATIESKALTGVNVLQIGAINKHPFFFVGSEVYVASDIIVPATGTNQPNCVCIDCGKGECYCGGGKCAQ